ncbi:MAG: hypothetical protein JXR61_00855 [Prolixibacteraceae bacterium]|nr:hypothetical protein [Prolixibacteraceae bacterium]
MLIKEIKVRDLHGFIKSEEYSRLDIKPITELRALSQINNPDADSDDIALIYVANNNELLGFAGLLPRYINGEKVRIFSNSCWWAHPQKGKGIAIPLLFKLAEKANFNLFLSESPPQIQPILEKSGLFELLRKDRGIRGFIRFYFADIFAKRFKDHQWISKLIVPFDIILNFIFSPLRLFYQIKFGSQSFEIDPVSEIDENIFTFIKEHSKSELVQKTPATFQWFKNYPWVKEDLENEFINYPFTHRVKKYELCYFVLRKENEIKAFVAISNRDNLSKIPYIYFNSCDIREVFYTVMKLILIRKYDSIVVFHPEIIDFIRQNKMPFFRRKKEIKYSGTTKQIYQYFKQKPIIQDGDGDVIFT